MTKPHYPHYNILDAAEDWDPHTREIVKQRIQSSPSLKHFSSEEAKNLYQIAATLVDDDRKNVITYVVNHIDTTVGCEIGEAQRKPGVPQQADLIRRAVTGLNKAAHESYQKPFYELSLVERQTILGRLERGEIPPNGICANLPQKEAFSKLLTLSVEAYYSHPTIWSEIGHGGPAYPRGYIRTEPGLLDPWEAKWEE